jgi:ribosomal protein S27E
MDACPECGSTRECDCAKESRRGAAPVSQNSLPDDERAKVLGEWTAACERLKRIAERWEAQSLAALPEAPERERLAQRLDDAATSWTEIAKRAANQDERDDALERAADMELSARLLRSHGGQQITTRALYVAQDAAGIGDGGLSVEQCERVVSAILSLRPQQDGELPTDERDEPRHACCPRCDTPYDAGCDCPSTPSPAASPSIPEEPSDGLTRSECESCHATGTVYRYHSGATRCLSCGHQVSGKASLGVVDFGSTPKEE